MNMRHKNKNNSRVVIVDGESVGSVGAKVPSVVIDVSSDVSLSFIVVELLWGGVVIGVVGDRGVTGMEKGVCFVEQVRQQVISRRTLL